MIPLFAPNRQNEPLFQAIETKWQKILRSGEFILGPEVEQFEKTLARNLGYRDAVGCASGTEALVIALRALGLEPGDEVITSAYSFVASANSILWAGLKPVFADVDLETACVTVESVQAVLTRRTRAVLCVDLYGRQAPIAPLRKLCDAHSLFLIEDGAQSIGVPKKGAHLYTTSFYPTKNVGAAGDAGAILTDSPELALKCREITRHGGIYRDEYARAGTTGRIDALQAAVLNVKLPHLGQWTKMRQTFAHWYREHLMPMQTSGRLWLPELPSKPEEHVWALFTVRVPQKRNDLHGQLKAEGVASGIYYPKALTEHAHLKPYAPREYPSAERLAREVLSLPIYPELTGKEFEEIVNTVRRLL